MYAAAESAEDPEHFLRGLRVERGYADLLQLVLREAVCYRNQENHTPAGILRLIEATRGLRQPERFRAFLDVCDALWPPQSRHKKAMMLAARDAAHSVPGGSLARQGLSGTALAQELEQRRIAAIAAALEKNKNPINNDIKQ